MATGGFKSNAPADFLEEWKAKREKMRAKMLGDIAKATGVPLSPTSTSNIRLGAPPGTELCTNPDRGASAGNCRTSSASSPVARSPSGGTLNRPEEEAHHPAAPAAATPTAQGSNLKKAPPQMEKTRCASPDSSSMMACNNDSDKDSPSPSPSKGKEKKNSGPSARKGKGQIEKRKLREKRRSTGVVSIPSNESLDELDDDDAREKDRREEEELVQANTFQNESMTTDPDTGYPLETPKAASGHFKSSARQGMEDEAGGNIRQRENRHSREGGGANLEKRVEELEKELSRLVKVVQDKDEVIEKLKEEIELLNLDLDEFEDENEQLKQENKTLLKVVGQLTR